MASSVHHSRRKSMDRPPEMADLIRLKMEFTELDERDYPELQQCIQRLHHHMEKFEKEFRDSTKGSRDARIMRIARGCVAVAGFVLGLALIPVTMGASLVVSAAAVGGGLGIGGGAVYKGSRSHSEKSRQMTELRKNIEEELKTFQEKINPVNEKMKELHEQTETIMRDFETLQQESNDVGIYSDSLSNLRQEDLDRLRADMAERMLLIQSIAEIFNSVRLLFDMMSVSENTRALDDMEKLAQQPRDKEMSESEMETEAGKFITGMRNAIHRLQNIIDELEKTKWQIFKIQSDNNSPALHCSVFNVLSTL